MRRKLVVALLAVAAAWLAFGGWTRSRRARREPPPAGEIRGAWHVHTLRSDGRGSVDEVARAAREAGLQFVVVADHNVLTPADAGYRDGVLVVAATEISSKYGHVVAVGLPGPPGPAEREDPFGRIAEAGGGAVVAHPLHPRRAFTGWGSGPWRGLEVVSNDSAWYQVLRDRAVGRILLAALALPFDRAQAVLWLSRPPAAELALFDSEAAKAAAAALPLPAFLCSADAHGYPSYGAAFEAFSMHLPVTLTGDAAADTRAVVAALLDGRGSCVFDGVAPAGEVRLAPAGSGALELTLEAAGRAGARVRLLADGRQIEAAALPPEGPIHLRLCAAGCPRGSYRAEVTLGGRPWIFTNPVALK